MTVTSVSIRGTRNNHKKKQSSRRGSGPSNLPTPESHPPGMFPTTRGASPTAGLPPDKRSLGEFGHKVVRTSARAPAVTEQFCEPYLMEVPPSK